MEYDSIKDRIGRWLDSHPKLIPLFYTILNLLFLRTWYVHRALRKINPGSDSRLLDAGTGFGQYAWHAIRKYPELHVTATDLKKDHLERASRCFDAFGLSNRIDLQVDDLTKPEISESFDCILAIDVLEHIEEDEAAIHHFAQRLCQGGYLIISTPSDLGGSDVYREDQKSFISEHVRDGYNLNDLIQKLTKAGLEIVQAQYSYGVWGSMAWRMLIKFPMLLLGRSLLLTPLVALYYVPVLPLGLLLNALDLYHKNEQGTGLIVVASQSA